MTNCVHPVDSRLGFRAHLQYLEALLHREEGDDADRVFVRQYFQQFRA
jgi:hypothetical protein